MDRALGCPADLATLNEQSGLERGPYLGLVAAYEAVERAAHQEVLVEAYPRGRALRLVHLEQAPRLPKQCATTGVRCSPSRRGTSSRVLPYSLECIGERFYIQLGNLNFTFQKKKKKSYVLEIFMKRAIVQTALFVRFFIIKDTHVSFLPVGNHMSGRFPSPLHLNYRGHFRDHLKTAISILNKFRCLLHFRTFSEKTSWPHRNMSTIQVLIYTKGPFKRTRLLRTKFHDLSRRENALSCQRQL